MTKPLFDLLLRGQRPILAVGLVLLIAAGGVKWQSTLMPEDTSIPTVAMPSPNARDIFDAAEALMRDRGVFSWPSAKPLTDAEKSRIVGENGPALAKLREGLNYPYRAPQAGRVPGQLLFFDTKADGAMSSLLALVGQAYIAKGDWGGAMNAYIDEIRFDDVLQFGGSLGYRSAWAAIPHLSAAQAEAAVQRLARMDADGMPPAQLLQEAKWREQAALLKLFGQPHWRSSLYKEIPKQGMDDSAINLTLHMESPRTVYDNYSRYANARIARAEAPWSERDLPKIDPPTDLINRSVLSFLDTTGVMQFSNIALDRLLEVQLALRAYQADHGRYPEHSSGLIPGYLPAMPLDPFSDRQPLHYYGEGDHYFLYSIGPDGVDSKGRAIINTDQPSELNLLTGDPEAKGDIVAGMNW